MSEEKKYWLDQRRNIDRLYWGLVIVCVVLGLADLAVHRHDYFGFDGWFNFYGFFGFAAFWCIVIIGKNLRRFLWRPEDYYD
jgi:uncharacterized membrane protein